MLRTGFANRVLPFDSAAASAYAEIAAARRAMGRPIPEADCQIAAIARSRGMAVATRNVRDFADAGIDVIRIRVEQIPSGEVTATKILDSSGNVAFDRSVITAINNASPLPVPRDKRVFSRVMNFTFIP